MQSDATKYVRNCDSCQRFKVQQKQPASTMHATNVTQPWEMISTDLVGPFPRSKAGNCYLLVTQDRFSKWVELHALRKATANAICWALKEVCLRHGCPRSVVSDNGRQFTSKEFKQLLKDLHIEHRNTPPYTPQCNPVERTNRVIKTLVRQYIDRSQTTWDKYLNEIAFTYNTARSDFTGFSPAYLNYGRELTPRGSLSQEVGQRSTVGVDARIKRLQDAHELTRTNLAKSFQKQQRQYNLRRRDWRPAIGTRVLRKEHTLPNKAKDYNAKLCESYGGPYTVHRKVSPVIYDLKDDRGKIVRHIHVRDLQLYKEAEE